MKPASYHDAASFGWDFVDLEKQEKINSEFADPEKEIFEAISENDDELMMKFLEGEQLTEPEIIAGLRKAVVSNKIIPAVCGTA